MIVTRRLGFCIAVLACCGCSFELDPSQSWNSLSVEKYQKLTARDEACRVIPVADADSIDFGWKTQRDGYDYWWNLNGIVASEHVQLLNSVRESLERQGYIEKKVESVANHIPESWPYNLLDVDWPVWWKKDDSVVECVAWERETKGGSSTRSYGWVLRYDGKSQASIWHFGCQHSWFGWSDEQRKKE